MPCIPKHPYVQVLRTNFSPFDSNRLKSNVQHNVYTSFDSTIPIKFYDQPEWGATEQCEPIRACMRQSVNIRYISVISVGINWKLQSSEWLEYALPQIELNLWDCQRWNGVSSHVLQNHASWTEWVQKMLSLIRFGEAPANITSFIWPSLIDFTVAQLGDTCWSVTINVASCCSNMIKIKMARLFN